MSCCKTENGISFLCKLCDILFQDGVYLELSHGKPQMAPAYKIDFDVLKSPDNTFYIGLLLGKLNAIDSSF